MGKWILYLGLIASLRANTLYWSSPTASPANLGLDSVFAVNNAGTAVGLSGGQAAAASTSSPRVIGLGIPFPFSTGMDINNSGQIAGTYETASGYLYGFFWSQASGMVPLGTLGGQLSTAFAINEHGDVVGQTMDGAGNLTAYLWSQNQGMSRIGDSGSYIAVDINDSGSIAYQQDPYPYSNPYAATGDRTSVAALDFCGPGATIVAMNNDGWIIGYTADSQGFLWTPSATTNFGTSFLPRDMNNAGQIVGSYLGRPAIWTRLGGFQFLDLGGMQGGVSVVGISDNGQIVGDTVAPEPSSLALFGIGAFLLAAGWRKRAAEASGRFRESSQSPATGPERPN